MEQPREYKHLGNPHGKVQGVNMQSNGFFRYRPKANKFSPLFNTIKKGNAKFTREGMAGAKPRTPPSSARQLYGKVPANISQTSFFKSIDRGKQDNERFTKIWGQLTR